MQILHLSLLVFRRSNFRLLVMGCEELYDESLRVRCAQYVNHVYKLNSSGYVEEPHRHMVAMAVIFNLGHTAMCITLKKNTFLKVNILIVPHELQFSNYFFPYPTEITD